MSDVSSSGYSGIWLQAVDTRVQPRTAPHTQLPPGVYEHCCLEGFPFMFMKVPSSTLNRKVSEFIVQSSCILQASAQNEFDIFRIQGVIEKNMRLRPLVLKLLHMCRIQFSPFSRSLVSDTL